MQLSNERLLARVVVSMITLYFARAVSSSICSNEPPTCAPSRTAGLADRHPAWLAHSFDAVGIPTTTKAGTWPWSKSIPTTTFTTTRNASEMLLFSWLAIAGVLGAFMMEKQDVSRLFLLHVLVAAAVFGAISLRLHTHTHKGGPFEEVIQIILLLGTGAAIEAALAAVPIVCACGRAVTFMLGGLKNERVLSAVPTHVYIKPTPSVASDTSESTDLDSSSADSDDDEHEHWDELQARAQQDAYWHMVDQEIVQ